MITLPSNLDQIQRDVLEVFQKYGFCNISSTTATQMVMSVVLGHKQERALQLFDSHLEQAKTFNGSTESVVDFCVRLFEEDYTQIMPRDEMFPPDTTNNRCTGGNIFHMSNNRELK